MFIEVIASQSSVIFGDTCTNSYVIKTILKLYLRSLIFKFLSDIYFCLAFTKTLPNHTTLNYLLFHYFCSLTFNNSGHTELAEQFSY